MKAIYYIGFFVALISLPGCGSLVQEVDPDNIPTSAAKLVIHSYISPQDTILAVVVEAPRAVLGQQTNYFTRASIANATVDLSDGTRTVRLPYVSRDGLYYTNPRNLPIVAGRTYTLTVSAPNYPTASAQCTVPSQVMPTEIRIDSTYRDNFEQRQLTTVGRLVWQDPGGQANYYRVTGVSSKTVIARFSPRPNMPPRDTMITQINSLSFDEPSIALANDKGKDGERFVSPSGFPRNYNFGQSEQLLALRFTMTLLATDEPYYRYHDAIQRQDRAGDNPFAEPVLIPTNIQNGLGCFAAFNQASLTVRVK